VAAPDPLPTPRWIGASDIARLESDTRVLRALDHRHGGEACLEAVLLRVRECAQTAEASATAVVRQRWHIALADLHNLAGWVCFDAGLTDSARRHFDHALVLAGRGGQNRLIADICCRLGRMCLHHGNLDDALGYFELGQCDATGSGDEIGAGILSMNAAWAHAKRGDEDMARILLNRGSDHFAAVGDTPVPEWAKFFTENDLSALSGAVHTDLASTANPRHTRIAVRLLARAVDGYGDAMARSRAFSLILLATNHLIEGDLDRAVDIGFRALVSAEDIGSARVRDQLRPLGVLAGRHGFHAGARELSARIASGIAVPVRLLS
jgi:hypothetical protein